MHVLGLLHAPDDDPARAPELRRRQRVAVARALVNRPGLVIGDEPTGNLDSARSAEILGLLRRLDREQGQTFLIVTHDAEVGAACDRIIRMRDGLVVDDGRSASAAA